MKQRRHQLGVDAEVTVGVDVASRVGVVASCNRVDMVVHWGLTLVAGGCLMFHLTWRRSCDSRLYVVEDLQVAVAEELQVDVAEELQVDAADELQVDMAEVDVADELRDAADEL
jgi:hypothetical protein